FMAALIKQTTSSGVLMNPVKFQDVASSMLESVRADKGCGTEQTPHLCALAASSDQRPGTGPQPSD
ncbi:LytR family transcriptional regulator, partial [Streptomyces sp. FT05W]